MECVLEQVAGSWTPTDGSAGQAMTRLAVTADVLAASLQWATATLIKATRSAASPDSDERDTEQAPT